MNADLFSALRARVRGDLLPDPISRGLYATDASIYQIEPLGVVVPLDEQDVAETLRLARRRRVPLVPRGGGTSLAGQAIGRAIQLDFSKYMRHLLELNPSEGWAWVEPGMVLDHLNTLLAPQGLMFAPDVSPSNRATIGGMIGTNAAGMYSLVYGKTIDHVLELRVMLSDGSVVTLGPLDDEQLRQKLTLDSLEGRLYRAARRLGREHAAEIARRYPRILRRVGGYNLDAFVPPELAESIDRSRWHPPAYDDTRFNLARMIVGSEGTLAIVLAAKLRLVPRPRHTAIGVIPFDTLDAALEAVVPCLECTPAAVELMDEMLLGLARASRAYRAQLAAFVSGEPAALLQVEFFGDTADETAGKLDALEQHLRGCGWRAPITRALTAQEKAPILQVRKAGMPLLMSLSPDRRPETFVEDTAVAPEKLSAYIRRFRAIAQAHGAEVAFYGHASVGLMHARPLLNLKLPEDVARMRAIAEAIKDLVIEFGGALSGEHGDGLVRSEFNRALFGDTLYGAFQEIKRAFDPRGLLNPGKIVDAPPMDQNLRYGQHHAPSLETHFRFRDTGGFAGAADLCNGNALCRKTAGGTMCPSYMVTRDEEHSTRGRANALRLALSGALPLEALAGRRIHEVMDLCIECKGCSGECPSRVNMTRLKAEWLSHYHAAHGVPPRARLFASIRRINQAGSALAPFSNWLTGLPGAGALAELALGISHHRRLPRFAREPFHRWFQKHRENIPSSGAGSRTVLLFADTFTLYNEPEIGRAALRVLEAAGYQTLLPERLICCGRPAISKGLLNEAKELAARQLEALARYVEAGVPIVGLEPSCILTFRDEYPDLLDDPRATVLARNSFLIDEFLAGLPGSALPLRDQGPRTILFHGHCHQKALVGSAHALALLRAIPNTTAREVDSGCCGMAGSFGYEAEHYAISQAIGERALFPALRALPADADVVAMGTSCRQQIAHATGRRARHLVEVLAEAIEGR